VKLTVYKTLKKQVKPAATVELTETGIEILSTEKMLPTIILQTLKTPQVVRVIGKGKVTHRKPETVWEHIKSGLKNKLHFPYWVGPKNQVIEDPAEKINIGTLEIEKVMGQDHKDVDTQLRAVDNSHGLGINKSPAELGVST
jgi:hypothetical protein